MKPISAILPQVCRQLSRNEDSTEYLISAVWKSVVGKPLSFRTQPAECCGNKLVVLVPSLTWQKQLKTLQSEIINRLNQVLNSDITKLEFRIDPRLENVFKKRVLDEVKPTLKPVKLQLDGIMDKELRDCVEMAARRYLSRPE